MSISAIATGASLSSMSLLLPMQVDLPGDAEPVVQPGKAPAETVVARRHEEPALLAERGDNRLEFLGRARLDEKRERRREGEGVVDGAVAHHHLEAAERGAPHHDAAFLAGPLGPVAAELADAA